MDILLELNLNPRHIRVKTHAASKHGGKSGSSQVRNGKVQSVVNYTIKLRKDAKLLAEAVVLRLKQTFADKAKRKVFLQNFWQRVRGIDAKGLGKGTKTKVKVQRMINRIMQKSTVKQPPVKAIRRVVNQARRKTGRRSYTGNPTKRDIGGRVSKIVDSKNKQTPEAAGTPSKPDQDNTSPTSSRSVGKTDDIVKPDEAANLTAELDGMISNRETEVKKEVKKETKPSTKHAFAAAAQTNMRQQHMLNHLRRLRAQRANKSRNRSSLRYVSTRRPSGTGSN